MTEVQFNMKKRQIINIVNFIRNTEPRMKVDLYKPVAEQIRLMREYSLRGTFLLQYDALMNPVYTDLLKTLPAEQFEIGVWFEMVQELAEQAGVEWHGSSSWDWHAQYGFSVGYTLEQREKMLDILFGDFKKIFGYYPKSLGSWAFDAHSLEYASEKYNVCAYCNCKEQFGTDGYTLWGGYYGQAYYPSKRNAHCPAQSKEMQIKTPVFKMLGSDPIYQYDAGMNSEDGPQLVQSVITLEPVYTGKTGGGGIPAWVDWYMKENFSGKCLSFGYAQAGQENSFGWNSMGAGLEYQFPLFARLRDEGKIEVEPLAETGEWYRKTFAETPASVIAAFDDWMDKEHKSVWYCSKNYRVNFYAQADRFRIRDIYLFREDYSERYFTELCSSDKLTFDNLPFVDGNVYSGKGIRAGLYPFADGKPITFESAAYDEQGSDTVKLSLRGTQLGTLEIVFTPEKITVKAEKTDRKFCLVNLKCDTELMKTEIKSVCDDKLTLCYRGYEYSIKADKGIFSNADTLISDSGEITISLT